MSLSSMAVCSMLSGVWETNLSGIPSSNWSVTTGEPFSRTANSAEALMASIGPSWRTNTFGLFFMYPARRSRSPLCTPPNESAARIAKLSAWMTWVNSPTGYNIMSRPMWMSLSLSCLMVS